MLLLLYLLILLPAYLIIVGDSENDYSIIKQNCLSTGGTVVEFPEGKFERCIPR